MATSDEMRYTMNLMEYSTKEEVKKEEAKKVAREIIKRHQELFDRLSDA